MATCTSALPGNPLDVLGQGTLIEQQSRMIYELNMEAVVFALLLQAKRIAEQPGGGGKNSFVCDWWAKHYRGGSHFVPAVDGLQTGAGLGGEAVGL